MLKFSTGNSKINKLAKYLGLSNKQVVCFDLPAGHTCPCASLCKSTADRVTGKITDGENCQFRCYAASNEAVFKSARALRWHNYDELVACSSVDSIASLILASIPNAVKVVRIHSSGDFFSKKYFQAWVKVAIARPDVKFFGYTKVLPYVNFAKPDNFRLVYSFGGVLDNKVTSEPVAYVVNTVADAESKSLQVSCQTNPSDDYDFVMAGQSFALVLHGTQPKKG